MNALDAACQVLKEAGQPLHYQDLTNRILSRGLWQTKSKAPEISVNSALSADIREKGPDSQFYRAGSGVFALRTASPTTKAHQTRVEAAVSSQAMLAAAMATVSFTDAAEHVLSKYANRQPMHYQRITEKALQLGLVRTAGKTPEINMNVSIRTEIQRHTLRGERPRFFADDRRGYYGLTAWIGGSLAERISEHNKRVQEQLQDELKQMAPADFESLVGRLLAALGFEEVQVTNVYGDNGIDVRATLVVGDVIRTRMAVQVKRWASNVQAPVVQQVRGSLGTHEQGLIITTSDFSPGARQEASRPDAIPVALMNGEQLVNLLVEHEIGVRRESHYLIELGEEDEG
ncbi:MAG: HTH domain-containing protein [Chloroflexota bacterium]